MNQKPLNSNLVSVILVAFAALFIAVLPVRLQVVPNSSSAQSTLATTVEYTLRMVIGQTPPMAFIGVGGDIDGVINPELKANVGDTVKITVVNGDPVLHDMTIDEFGVTTGQLTQQDQQAVIEFVADKGAMRSRSCATPATCRRQSETGKRPMSALT
jgi:nitrite reductase (NO-forming)